MVGKFIADCFIPSSNEAGHLPSEPRVNLLKEAAQHFEQGLAAASRGHWLEHQDKSRSGQFWGDCYGLIGGQLLC
jgi:hypothetical protein